MQGKVNFIDICGTVIIRKDAKSVFEYLSNYENDKHWRKPINWSKMNTSTCALATLIEESTYLSRSKPEFISTFKCIEFEPAIKVVCETTAETVFWSKNSRIVDFINSSTTRVRYRFQLDSAIVKYGLGFSLPRFLILAYTNIEMKLYLKSLKKILEK